MSEEQGANNDALLRQLQELYQQANSLVSAFKSNKIAYYKPVGRQGEFHNANGTDTRLVLGGNRSGKTTCGVVEAIAHALGYRPWLDPDDPNYVVRLADGSPIPVPNVGRVGLENYETNIVQTIFPKFQEWLPERYVKHIQTNPRSVPVRIDLINGSVIHFVSYNQDKKSFEGPAGHWFWCDEPPPQDIFNGLKRGLIDNAGVCWLTLTPLAEPWIASVLFANANSPGSDIRAWEFSIWDNCVENGGHLTRKAILSFLEKLPPLERQTREDGKFLHLAGRVFPEWKAEPPYWVKPYYLPPDWPRVCVIDPHPNKPVAVTWLCIDPDNRVIVYRDLADASLYTVEEVAEEMKLLEGWQYDTNNRLRPTLRTEQIAMRIIDTSANQNDITSGKTVKDEFARCGIKCTDAYKRNKSAGIDSIRNALRPSKYQWGGPSLIVFDTCENVKQNFLFYAWPRITAQQKANPKTPSDEPVKLFDDHIDGIRYYYQKQLSYQLLKGVQRELSRFADREEDKDDGLPFDWSPQHQINHGRHAGYQRMTRPNVRCT